MNNLALASFCLFLASLPGVAQNPRHPFTFDDAATLHCAVPVAISPDGKSILQRATYDHLATGEKHSGPSPQNLG